MDLIRNVAEAFLLTRGEAPPKIADDDFQCRAVQVLVGVAPRAMLWKPKGSAPRTQNLAKCRIRLFLAPQEFGNGLAIGLRRTDQSHPQPAHPLAGIHARLG